MNVEISSAGLATAQGGAREVVRGATLRAPGALPWHDARAACKLAYAAEGAGAETEGGARWRALARAALEDCFGGALPPEGTPLLLASCNGAASRFDSGAWRRAFDSEELLRGTPWAKRRLPVFSSSCNSGAHALYAGARLLAAGAANEVVVLAADVLAPACHDNFESLRVLDERPAPWRPASAGFVLGEAAVALRLRRRATGGEAAVRLEDAALGSDLSGHDALSAASAALLARAPKGLSARGLKFILGQGTGPFESDAAELSALRRAGVGADVPLTTTLAHFGHTLGASSLLSVALAALALKSGATPPALRMNDARASDGRPLLARAAEGDRPAEGAEVLVTCRALSGACAAVRVGRAGREVAAGARGRLMTDALPERRARAGEWRRGPCEVGPLMDETLRRVASEAPGRRPSSPPDLLVVRMDEPLVPRERASIGGRLLPSAVLEMTPGFVPQLVARRWGFDGGALCLVGGGETDRAVEEIVAGLAESGLVVSRLNLRGVGGERAIEWNG